MYACMIGANANKRLAGVPSVGPDNTAVDWRDRSRENKDKIRTEFPPTTLVELLVQSLQSRDYLRE